MKIEKIEIPKEKKDINLKFYCFLKYTIKLKFNNNQIDSILEYIKLFNNDILTLSDKIKLNYSKNRDRSNNIIEIFSIIDDEKDLKLFEFSLLLLKVKDLLLEESKVSVFIDNQLSDTLNPLSYEYDKVSIMNPFNLRINGALLALLFFEKLNCNDINFISKSSYDFFHYLSQLAIEYKNFGLESNQIFMLVFNESLNQSIKSTSGSNYEDRILSVLTKIPIKNIKKCHDIDDKSIEYDFLFTIENKIYGISAKRTLRERYKQSININNNNLDVLIIITLGIDLNEQKANTITEKGIYIFVADDIYQFYNFMKNNHRIYSAKDLSMETLINLI